MTTDFAADQELISAFGPFYASVPPISTHEMLCSLAKRDAVARFLAPYDITFLVLIQDYDRETTEPGLTELTVLDSWGDEDQIRFTTPMVAALDRAQTRPSLTYPNPQAAPATAADLMTATSTERSPVDLLAAILDDEECLAVSNLTKLGVDVTELRAALTSGQPAVREDLVPTELRSTRDALLGRRKYKPIELGQFWTSVMMRIFPMNPGQFPDLWARLEAGEVAQAHGGKVRSDDLLLAILRTHTVAAYYPHMAVPMDENDDSRAARILLGAGLDHHRLRAAMDSSDLGKDAVPLKKQMKNYPRGTTELLRRLLDEPGNRAVRLLQTLNVDPVALRAQLT
ncbi:Clp protease N-terminal domain-containing protein [Kineosporia babensis]|uniref:Uncharacterized protein n=1 Tax=Kineosporia babensis TaxID=499548 RepID=A0A9X1T0K1_9ACTN|nr:Clp protease N-terminal domain-containing protein [Kineosporia babensis]MCD5312823.1 hypothetical protein [Kineosporia babensis]